MPTRHAYGYIPKTTDTRDFLARATAPYTGAFVDLTPGMPPVYDQLDLGACVPNGTAAAVDYARKKEGLAQIGPSRLFIYFNGRALAGYPIKQDTGLQIRDGFTSISKDGAPAETDWPYVVEKFADKPPAQAYTDGLQDLAITFGSVAVSDIDATIASGWPVVFGFSVHESFESDEVAQTGIMPVPKRGEENLGGHCVVAVSTVKDGSEIGGVAGTKYRLCRNSWSEDWGLNGYFWMPTSQMETADADCWMVTAMSSPDAPVPPAPTPTPTPEPTPTPDDALTAAVRKMAADPDVQRFLEGHHSSYTRRAVAQVQAVVDALG